MSDGSGDDCDVTANVVVTVKPVNDCPVATADVINTDEDTPATINVLDNDIDPEGDPLTVLEILYGSAVVVDAMAGTVKYT